MIILYCRWVLYWLYEAEDWKGTVMASLNVYAHHYIFSLRQPVIDCLLNDY
jgi:hypothetical protein